MNVKIIKLVSGEEVLAEVVKDDGATLEIKNTLAIAMLPQKDGTIGFQFIPWGSMVNGTITIDKTNVIYAASDIKYEVVSRYNSVFGNIIAPSPELII